MLSPKAAGLAVKNGYTNVRVFHDGEPAWSKADYPLAASAKQIREGNIVLIDLRTPATFSQGHIARAVNIPFEELRKRYTEATFPEYKGSLIVFTGDNRGEIDDALELMKDWGFNRATFFPGGPEQWKRQEIATATGSNPAPSRLTYTRKLAPHEVSIGDFTKALSESTALIVDARSGAEFAAGHFKGAVSLPSEEMEKRFAEIPRDKPAYLHCSTGARAEMAHDILKEKGFTNVKLLKATIEFTGDTYKITE